MRNIYYKRKKLEKELINNFIEDKQADTANSYNEKQLDKTIKKVIAINKKKLLKPINTHLLLS
jgi:hypothetical protein